MAFELKDGNGSLFRNERRDRDNSPEYTGTIKIAGNEYYLNAWVKEGNKGKFFSLTIKPKSTSLQQRAMPRQPELEPGFSRDLDDDIPW